MTAWLAIGALVASVPVASAAPRGKQAKAAFKQGVAAYQKGDYAAASEALGRSFELEADVETLFAWAQSERQQENCETAIELYTKLLALDLPAENKAVIQAKHDECKTIIAAKAPPPEPPPEPDPDPEPEPEPAPLRVETAASGSSPWWQDPIGDVLVLGGIGGLVAGGIYLYRGRQDEQASLESHDDFRALQDRAEARGRTGVIASIAGGVLLLGGIVRYATRGGGEERTAVSGWITPDGGGLAALGRF